MSKIYLLFIYLLILKQLKFFKHTKIPLQPRLQIAENTITFILVLVKFPMARKLVEGKRT